MRPAELSIIIPTLNEEEALPLLLDDLSNQQSICFEVIVSDGGSQDLTKQLTNGFFTRSQLSGRFLSGLSGRGRQLNSGADAAHCEFLLFLHADSRFSDELQLRKAVDKLKETISSGDGHVAGRFKLRFDNPSDSASFAYKFYEIKAELGREGCIHGDQGMLLSQAFFREVGPFREDLPVMEDTCFADVLRKKGRWQLLSGEIVTSARRFQVEGMKPRQTLNALMMNFLSIGWLDFFADVPDLYRQQVNSGPLKIKPFLCHIDHLLKQASFKKRCALWMATGRYVRSQGWQIGLFLDCQSDFKKGTFPGDNPGPWLRRFDQWFEPLTNHWLGHLLTAILVKVWFECRLRCG